MPRQAAILNVAAYKFVALADAPELRGRIGERAGDSGVMGTVLVAPEGINLVLAGEEAAVRGLMAWLTQDPRFADLDAKESWSRAVPFKRLRVRLKREIITMRTEGVAPMAARAPAVDPATLKRWLDRRSDDDGRPVVLLDTRNGFEVATGTFEGAIDFGLRSFGDFPEALAGRKAAFDGATVVSFCTGGIRCEKAAPLMLAMGIDNVYQLDGGILKYFEEVGGAHWRGDCFVFDERVALTPKLEEIGAVDEVAS